MKKWMYLICVLIFFILVTGCGGKESTSNEVNDVQSDPERISNNDSKQSNPKENNDAAENADQENQIASKSEDISKGSKQSKNTIEVNPKLQDYKAMKEFLMNDDIFGMGYHEAEGQSYNDDHYVLRHFDFTEDGELDTVIITYTDESDYRTVVFITLENDQYKYYLSDVRASMDTEFYYEDGFIIKESNGYCNLLKVFAIEGAEHGFVRHTYGSFSKDSVAEWANELCPTTKYKDVVKVTKIDGLKSYQTEYKQFFYDENEKEHLINHSVYQYDYDEDNFEHQSKEITTINNDLNQIILDNLIIGNNKDLQKFDETLSKTSNLKKAIDYYLSNRQKFDKESRINYLEDTLDFINSFSYYDAMVYDEVIQDASIAQAALSVFGDPNPIPDAAEELFKIVKTIYVDDGENLNMNHILDYPSYTITCIDPLYSQKIRMLKYDKDVISQEGNIGFIDRDDQYVDVIFDNGPNVIKQCDNIVYPTILIQNLSQINELNGPSIWKTNVVIIPEEIVFQNDVEAYDDSTLSHLKNETLYSVDEEMYIDYSKYYLVIIPAQDSTNDSENKISINMSETGNETASQFTIHGMLDDVTLTYTPNGMDNTIEPVEQKLGHLANAKVTVNAYMATDNATITVTGKYYYDIGDFEEISFSLDDCRDPSSYPIIAK